jgi:outer membrane protein assembly factor BamB
VHDAGILEGRMLLFDVKQSAVAIAEVDLESGNVRPVFAFTGAKFPDQLVVRVSAQEDRITVSADARPGERLSIRVAGRGAVEPEAGAAYCEVTSSGLEPGTHLVQVDAQVGGGTVRSGSAKVVIMAQATMPAWENDLGESVLWPIASDKDEELVYVAGEKGFLYAVDIASGRTSWKTNLGSGPSGGPIIAGDLVLCPTSRGYVIALEKRDGTYAWGAMCQEPPCGTPAVDGTRVYLPCGRMIVALDAKTGRQVWAYDTGARAGNGIAVDDGRVFVGLYDGRLLCLSDKGDLVWQQAVETSFYYSPVFSAPVVSSGLVIVTTPLYAKGTGRTLHAFRVADGARAWSVNAGTTLSGVTAVADGFLAATAAGKVAFVKDGVRAIDGVSPRHYSGVLSAGPGLAVAAGGQAAYGVDSRGYVFRVEWSSGQTEIKSLYSLGEGCYVSPVALGRDILVAGVAGRVLRLRFQDVPSGR